MRILVVDDDEDIREVIGLILREQGHLVDEAPDGVAALERLRTGERPSVILLDLMMPNLDGEGFMKAMKMDPSIADIPVWILSGHPHARQKAMELGAVGCLVKPVELEQMISVVETTPARRDAPI
jgi:CheY-like chemotaxis protein